ncbi:RING-type domain-containing protein [Aphelenchoides fujianensis]|nr:RING-type domain-containing protein [Aphelenchoides fujianensis]
MFSFKSLTNFFTGNKVSSAIDRAKDLARAKRPNFDEQQYLRMDAELLSCPVCYNVSPRVLPCGHTFCASCLKKLLTANPEKSLDDWMCSDRATLYSDLNAFKVKNTRLEKKLEEANAKNGELTKANYELRNDLFVQKRLFVGTYVVIIAVLVFKLFF